MSASIYVPGRGVVNLAARRIDNAVREYDERLFFARHPQNGQWSVFVKIAGGLPEDFGTVVEGQHAFPVVGFPHDRDPETLDLEEIMHKLYKADSMRHGTRILDEMHEHNEKVRAPARAAADDAAGAMAEVVESYTHGQGDTKYSRLLPLKGTLGRTAVRGH